MSSIAMFDALLRFMQLSLYKRCASPVPVTAERHPRSLGRHMCHQDKHPLPLPSRSSNPEAVTAAASSRRAFICPSAVAYEHGVAPVGEGQTEY
jgi:hypothetical protein